MLINKNNEKNIIEELNFSNEKPEQIEILDLTNEAIENTLEEKKEKRLIFLIIGLIILFVLLLPFFSRIFRKPNSTITTNAGKIVSKETNDGYLEIGSDKGSITALKIQFYSFYKRNDNNISYVYLSNASYKKTSDLNIYIELYNSKKSIIYRELFNPNESISKSRNTANIKLIDTIYKEAAYAKITILEKDSFNVEDKSLICKKNTENGIYTIRNTIIYNFSTNGLNSYNVNRTAEITDKDYYTSERITVFDEEKEIVQNYSFDNFSFKEDEISYKVDLVNKKYEGYKLSYSLGTTIREIKLKEETNEWSCS